MFNKFIAILFLIFISTASYAQLPSISQPLLIGSCANTYSITSATPTVPNSIFSSFTNFNRGTQLSNNVIINTVGIFANNAATIVLKIGLRVSTGTYTISVSQSVSHSGLGWQDFTLVSPFTTPLTGNYFIGGYSTATNIMGLSGLRAFKAGDITGSSQTGFTEDSNNTLGVRANGFNCN